ncbi:MAG: hypothetical protein LBT00_00925 [Spirochaetaceae bacterium]|jgi:hypothetical protein|nr:hypothetical protein [Spirochaetaceae bacterium]
MKIVNNVLELTKEEIIDVLNNNTEVSDINDNNRVTLVCIVNRGITQGFFTDKQYKWLWSKVVYILFHNNEYRNTKLGISGKDVYKLTGFNLFG